jgi:RHS repeat-associated protein
MRDVLMRDGQMRLAGVGSGITALLSACPSIYGYDEPPLARLAYDGLCNMHAQRPLAGIPSQASSSKIRETGLDYFGARYYAGAQGRFTSPDPFNAIDELGGQTFDDYLGNPQYWNKYAYSLNNPLKYKDSDGELPHAVV